MLPLLSEKKKKNQQKKEKSYFVTVFLYQEGPGCRPAFLVCPKQNSKSTKINECNKPRVTCLSQNSSQIWQDVSLFPPGLRF